VYAETEICRRCDSVSTQIGYAFRTMGSGLVQMQPGSHSGSLACIIILRSEREPLSKETRDELFDEQRRNRHNHDALHRWCIR
jgi:hypothetical protein